MSFAVFMTSSGVPPPDGRLWIFLSAPGTGKKIADLHC